MSAKVALNQIAVGTDICHVPRMVRIICGRAGADARPRQGRGRLEHFIQRVFNSDEKPYIEGYARPLWAISTTESSSSPHEHKVRRLAQLLAGRFAAKEAIKKALSPYWAGLRHITIQLTPEGQPYATYHAHDKHGGQVKGTAKLSIAHDNDYAVASVVLFLPDLTPSPGPAPSDLSNSHHPIVHSSR